MDPKDLMDDVAHEFLLVKVKRELDTVHDPEALRMVCVELVDLVERQKSMFRQLLAHEMADKFIA